MDRATLSARVMLLQQNVEIQAQQLTSHADNLKMLRGHLAEAQHWLNEFPEASEHPRNEADSLVNELIESGEGCSNEVSDQEQPEE